MADPPSNSGDSVVVPATKAKKKKAPKGTKKPRSELTPEEIAKLDAESAKRRNRRVEPFTPRPSVVIDLNVTPGSCSGGRPSVEMQRKQARPPSTATMPSPRVLFGEMPTPTPTVEDPFYAQFMENVIFEGRGEAFQTGGQGETFDPEETESQDGRGEYMVDEDFEADHGDSWHEEDDIYCEGEGDEEEEDGVDIAGEPLFIDELTQRAEAQKRKKSIRTGSYTQDEDKLICESWKEIGQDPRVGAQQKGIVFWTRVHKTFHEIKLFPAYQFTSDRSINLIQKRWFIQQECNKYCAALESVEARPVSGLGIRDMAFQSLEAFKARHNDKPFTLTHCWQIINNCPKFKDQYRELQRKRGKKAAALAGGGDGEALKRPRGKTNSKMDDKRDAASYALHETLNRMMSQKEVRDKKKRQGKEEQMKQYMELQTKKLEMEEAAKKRKIDMEEAARQRQLDMKEAARQRHLDIEAANAAARQRQLDIEATNAATKPKEVALAIMSVDLSKMSEKTRSWFEARQNEMFDADGLN